MAIVPRELKSGKVTYYATFTYNGGTVWERSGRSRRECEELEARRKREVANGTYSPELPRGSRTTVETWFTWFFKTRRTRSLENEIGLIENHVLSRPWIANTRLADVEPRTCLKLVDEIKGDGRIGSKSVALVYGVWKQAFKRAVFEGVIDSDPTILPRGSIRWKSRNKRKPYPREDALKLIRSEAIPWDMRVWIAVAFYTGMREGEVCGRRWRDWLRDWEPLTALSVHTQYEDKPLKTDDEEDVHPRMVPVHPELFEILSAWWSEGFELFFQRKPTLDDFIVPHRKLGVHTKSSAYKAFQRALAKVGVENRTLHATRNTFISVARSNGARTEVVESVTHNSGGDVIEDYTTWEWLTVCQAVALFDVSVDPKRNRAFLELQRLDSNRGEQQGKRWNRRDIGGNDGSGEPPETAAKVTWAALFDARQRRLLKLAEIEPGAERPGMAICRGLDAAMRGDLAAVERELAEAADALGLSLEADVG